MSKIRIITMIAVLCWTVPAWAADAFYSISLARLELSEGQPPSRSLRSQASPAAYLQAMQPYAVLDGPGEVYLDAELRPNWYSTSLLLRAPTDEDVTGHLYFPRRDLKGMVKLNFRVPADWDVPNPRMPRAPRQAFAWARRRHYERLWKRGVAGAAWFRHQAMPDLSPEPPRGGPARSVPGPQGLSATDLQRGFALFSGGWAVSESLQLERDLPPTPHDRMLVEVETLAGIDVPEYDWRSLLGDSRPDLDPLAERIPADQHAIFFPDLNAILAVRNWIQCEGVETLQLAQLLSADRTALARYDRQLGVSLDGASELLGTLPVQSVALTGSDPYFSMGTDVAILLETASPKVLASLLAVRIRSAADGIENARTVRGQVHGVPYLGVVTADRRISSYLAVLDRSVVVTNSLYQVERLADVQRGETAGLASLAEYAFFRNRYRRSDAEETALLVLTDAAIRRWCGPRWRIGNARRIREASRLIDARAANLTQLVSGQAQHDLPSEFGSLAFMTPIAELKIDQVTSSEASAYAQWRNTYQRNWDVAFDPIAIRLELNQRALTADVSVMPLILRSHYQPFVQLSAGTMMAPDAGDPHGALFHGVLAVNRRTGILQPWQGFAKTLNTDVVGWLGPTVSIYADDGPFWDEFSGEGRGLAAFFGPQGTLPPVAVRADVASRWRLENLLKALQKYVEGEWPSAMEWETRFHRERPYVEVFPSPAAEKDRIPPNVALYYAALDDVFLVALQEEVLRAAVDRELVRQAEVKNPFAPVEAQWLGSNVGLHVDRKILQAVAKVWQNEYQVWMQTQAWNNLPILNEWKRCFPSHDPVALYQKYWHARIVCPGGGEYVWNDQWQTYESTVYGHPGRPKRGLDMPPILSAYQTAAFGLTFENDGVRARLKLEK